MTQQNQSFDDRMGRIESLIGRIEQSADTPTREAAREVVSAILELHATGLSKMAGFIAQANGASQSLVDACLNDDLVRSLLLLHGLHPEPLESRVQKALENVRPYLHSHGGNVELLGISGGIVRLRMEGSCQGCPSSAATLRDTIERAIIEVAPDAAGIEVEGLAAATTPPGLVSLQSPASTQANGSPSDKQHCKHSTGNGGSHATSELIAQEI